MDSTTSAALRQFNNQVGIRFQLYNSLFTALPFHRIEKTGVLLSLLLQLCEDGYRKKMRPEEIISEFFNRHTSITNEQEQLNLLFRFVQYAERQVVLFDALEDAAFTAINDMEGAGSLKYLFQQQEIAQMLPALEKLMQDFSVRLVLTAHPTQFYPGAVLGIIHDLAKAISDDNVTLINQYLQQLGKTPFFKKQKPTPLDEAISLIWYLENVFYPAAGKIAASLKKYLPSAPKGKPAIQLGFWPGGDRDGNPYVTSEITLEVADALRSSIIKCYYLEVRKIKRRLTFEGVEAPLAELEKKLYNNIFIPGQRTSLSSDEILAMLEKIRNVIVHQHNGLFVELIDALMTKVETFGLYFASLDIRQESSVHGRVLKALETRKGISLKYCGSYAALDLDAADDALVQETLDSMQAMQTIQRQNGAQGCHRYIISQCSSAKHLLEVYELLCLSGWKEENLQVDIIPLFETIDDLAQAPHIMQEAYAHPVYRQHLQRRNNCQTIMLGFSDGTKDGGYLMANWSIYQAKEALSMLSATHGIEVIFFDGRGGPPARGGGKTHKFYASMSKNAAGKEIQLTVQGQTVSSNFGTVEAARYNIEQLMNAGIQNQLCPSEKNTLSPAQKALLTMMATESLKAYLCLREHPGFLAYLSDVSPLRFYAATNIGSRPTKRSAGTRLELKDLRAIPFVGAWAQLKQNVTGYYGVGTALKTAEEKGHWQEVKTLYHSSLFFRTLIDNCEMSMKKCFFPLTAHLSNDARHGEIWNMIYEEFELTQQMIFRLTGKNELMQDYPVEQLSIQMRERITLPLITIQQYSISRLRELQEQQHPLRATYEKLAMRCSFGIINAARNSA